MQQGAAEEEEKAKMIPGENKERKQKPGNKNDQKQKKDQKKDQKKGSKPGSQLQKDTQGADQNKLVEDANNQLIENVKWPPKQKFDFRQNFYEDWHKNLPSEELQESADNFASYLDENLEIWNVNQSTKVDFGLPDSSFSGKQPVIQLKEPTYEVEKLQIEQLSQKQMQSIWNTGSFDVPSKKFSIPYTWKISEWLVQGQQNIRSNLYQIFSLVLNVLLYMAGRFYRSHRYGSQRSFGHSFSDPTISDGLKHIFYQVPKILLGRILGFRQPSQMPESDLKSRALCRLLKERSAEFYKKNICSDEKKLDSELQQQLKACPNIEAQYQAIEQQFILKEWEPMLKQSILKEYDPEDPDYYKKVMHDQLQLFFDYLQNHKPENISQGGHASFIRYLRAYWIIQDKEEQYKEELIKKNVEIYENLRKNHPVKSQSILWLKLNQLLALRKEKAQLRKLTDARIAEELLKYKLVFQAEYYSYAKKHTEHFYDNQLLYADREKQKLPPHQMSESYPCSVKGEIVIANNSQYIKLYDQFTLHFKTFWRLKFSVQRFYYLTKGSFYLACQLLLYSKFGLRSLFSINKFPSKFYVPQNTKPELVPQRYEKPLIRDFLDNFDTIKKVQEKFEKMPDTAFFGKKWSRVLHYIECYFFRLLINGFVVLLVLNLALHILCITLEIIFGLTSYLWILSGLVVYQIWSFIFYDVDLDRVYHDSKRVVNFPILHLLFEFLINGIFQVLFAMLHVIVLDPFAILVLLTFGLTRFVFRSIYDFIMFQFIKMGARVPTRENGIAWRIKGPGVGNVNHYKKIEDNDVYLLIRGFLEGLILQQFEETVKQRISQTSQSAREEYDRVLKGFHVVRKDDFAQLKQAEQILVNKLVKEVNTRRSILPVFNARCVKFTDEELDKLIPISTEIIQGQVQGYNMVYIWKLLNVPLNDWKQLTKVIWERVFKTQDILKALDEEEVAARHEISRKVCQETYDQVMNKQHVEQYNPSKSSFQRSKFSKAKRMQEKHDQTISTYYTQNPTELNDIVTNQQAGSAGLFPKAVLGVGFSRLTLMMQQAQFSLYPDSRICYAPLKEPVLFVIYDEIEKLSQEKEKAEKKNN